jgi:hypothetical protein
LRAGLRERRRVGKRRPLLQFELRRYFCAMSATLAVRVWTMRVDGLDEAAVAPWLDLLDDCECRRAARFVFARNRIEFIAAHALLRAALASSFGAPPRAWDFVAGAHGKPAAQVGGTPAPLSFNLSHTAGMVGFAAVGDTAARPVAVQWTTIDPTRLDRVGLRCKGRPICRSARRYEAFFLSRLGELKYAFARCGYAQVWHAYPEKIPINQRLAEQRGARWGVAKW